MSKKLSQDQIFYILVYSTIILIGIFGAGCGGFFIISEIFSNLGGYSFLFISIPILILGLLLIYVSYKGIKKIINNKK